MPEAVRSREHPGRHGAAVYREVSDQPDPQLRERLRSLGYLE